VEQELRTEADVLFLDLDSWSGCRPQGRIPASSSLAVGPVAVGPVAVGPLCSGDPPHKPHKGPDKR